MTKKSISSLFIIIISAQFCCQNCVFAANEAEVVTPQNEQNKAGIVCIKMAEHLMGKEGGLEGISERSREYSELLRQLEQLGEPVLQLVTEDTAVPFLAKRIVQCTLAVRRFPRLQIHNPKEPDREYWASNTINERVMGFISTYAKPEYRGWWEYNLLFSRQGRQGPMKEECLYALAAISSPDSLPLLEAYYQWGPQRETDRGATYPVRKRVAQILGIYTNVEALDVIFRLWSAPDCNLENQADLKNAISANADWEGLIKTLPADRVKKYQPLIDALSKPPKVHQEFADNPIPSEILKLIVTLRKSSKEKATNKIESAPIQPDDKVQK